MYPPPEKQKIRKLIVCSFVVLIVSGSANAQNITLLGNLIETHRAWMVAHPTETPPTTLANAAVTIDIETEPTPPTADSESSNAETTVPTQFDTPVSSIEIARPGSSSRTPIERIHPRSEAVAGKTAWYQAGLLPLGIVLAVIGAIGLTLKKWKGTVKINGGDVLSVLTQTHLSQRQSVALVQMGGKLVFVGVTPQAITPIRVIEDREEAATVKTRLRIGGVRKNITPFETVVRDEGHKLADAMEPDASSETMPASGEHQVRKEITGLLDRLRSLRRDATQTSSIREQERS